ncbi:putative bifunctional diguanylate cyclase/phosphodiesterase [Roseibium aestuarii]|uniref:Bifunctional diguanylate cyclase/phosphodiesterase n=1 Tax=Roseibium aestuarii TaxID=2600299 RepID=A0ABW4K0R3_9HYPH|nr:EAL domain-containing protein [Roseibium aestuarii]
MKWADWARDGAVYLSLALLTWFAMVRANGFELLVEFVDDHEDWQLDEAFLGVITLGIFGFLYALQRHRSARREIEKRQEAETNITWISRHDVLTRLPNRRFLQSYTETSCEEILRQNPRGFCIFSIDLDGFKKVNDLLGHAGGDALLVECANRLSGLFDDGIVIRLGGDEFLMLVEPSRKTSAEDMARRILQTLCQPVVIDGIQRRVGASVGIARFPQDSRDLEEAIRFADMAMYVAKKNGDGLRHFEPDMLSVMREKAELEEAFRSALDRQEIVPHYQPLIDLTSGKVLGFEALARWDSSTLGSISPTQFIALAEETGLILALSRQLFEHACRDAATWPAHISLSFNLSPVELTDRTLGLQMLKIMERTGLAPNRLEIEITENVLIQDLEVATAILTDFQKAGVRVALDDFGTGYSNLAQLSSLQFDRIKIDRSLLTDFVDNERQRRIVEAIITFGRGLGVSMTAEGIETDSQATALQTFGCACGQGFLFGKALPPVEARNLIASSQDGPVRSATALGN